MNKLSEISDQTNVKVITGKSATGKTYCLIKEIGECCAVGKQCIVFSLFCEYRRMCDTLGGTYISVDVGFPSNDFLLPETPAVVYDFEKLSEDEAKQPFKDLLGKVYETVKVDTTRQKYIALDITPSIYDYTIDQLLYMPKNLRKYNAAICVACQQE